MNRIRSLSIPLIACGFLVVAATALASVNMATIDLPAGPIVASPGSTIDIPVYIDFSNVSAVGFLGYAPLAFDLQLQSAANVFTLPANFAKLPAASPLTALGWSIMSNPANGKILAAGANPLDPTSVGDLYAFDMLLTVNPSAPQGLTTVSLAGVLPGYLDSDGNVGLNAGSIEVDVVPEQSSMVVWGTGLLIVGGFTGRRNLRRFLGLRAAA